MEVDVPWPRHNPYPLCKDCSYFVESQPHSMTGPKCRAFTTQPDVIDGRTDWLEARLCRISERDCGIQARHFMQRLRPPEQPDRTWLQRLPVWAYALTMAALVALYFVAKLKGG